MAGGSSIAGGNAAGVGSCGCATEGVMAGICSCVWHCGQATTCPAMLALFCRFVRQCGQTTTSEVMRASRWQKRTIPSSGNRGTHATPAAGRTACTRVENRAQKSNAYSCGQMPRPKTSNVRTIQQSATHSIRSSSRPFDPKRLSRADSRSFAFAASDVRAEELIA